MSLGDSPDPPTQQTVTNTTEPYGPQQPHLNNLFARAENLYKNPAELYPGAFTAPQALQSNQAAAGLEAYATGPASNFVDSLIQANQFGLGDVLRPDTNPALAAYGDALSAQIGRGFEQEILPALRSEAVGSGNASSTRREIAAGIAGRGATDAIERAQSGLYNEAYGRGLDAYGRALALGPQSLQAGAYPNLLLDTVGQRQTALQQQDINEAIQRHNFGELEPISRLAQFQNFITGNFGSETTQNMIGATVPQPSNLRSGIGGALAGLQFAPMLSGAFPSLGAAAGPLGMGAGALLALLD